MRRSSAAARWSEALDAWRIPDEILAGAPEDPWCFPTQVFQRRADTAIGVVETPSAQRASDALIPAGSVLDVGAGGGAASLALLARSTLLTAVDLSADALAGLERRATAAGAHVRTIQGAWPDVARAVDVHDVVVCHHVAYNVPDIERFLEALDRHARRRVVLELTESHPMSDLSPLWMRFHGIERPSGPRARDLAAVLIELGIDAQFEQWPLTERVPVMTLDERASLARRRLCLPLDREPEVATALHALGPPPNDRVTIWWDARPEGRVPTGRRHRADDVCPTPAPQQVSPACCGRERTTGETAGGPGGGLVADVVEVGLCLRLLHMPEQVPPSVRAPAPDDRQGSQKCLPEASAHPRSASAPRQTGSAGSPGRPSGPPPGPSRTSPA